MTISSGANVDSPGVSEEQRKGRNNTQNIEDCVPEPTFGSADDPLVTAALVVDRWDATAIQRLKDDIHASRTHLQVIDSEDDDRGERGVPGSQQDDLHPIPEQRRLGKLSSSVSIMSSAPSSPVEREVTSPLGPGGFSGQRSQGHKTQSALWREIRTSFREHSHLSVRVERVCMDESLTNEMDFDGIACSEDESIITENNETVLRLASPAQRSSFAAVAAGESIIDGDMEFADGARFRRTALGECETDRECNTTKPAGNRRDRCPSSIIDSSSEAEDYRDIRDGRSGTSQRSNHLSNRRSPSGSSGIRHRVTVPAIQDEEA